MSDDFLRVIAELTDMHAAKQQDYGTDHDPWANLRAGEPYGIPAWVHTSTMVDHKSHRIQAFVTKGRLEHEGVRDSLIDRAVYAIAAVVLYDQEQPPANAYEELSHRVLAQRVRDAHINEAGA